MPQNNRNLILAMALSILVIIGWNYFFAAPQYQKEHSAQVAQQQGQPVEHAPGAVGSQPPRSPNAPPQGGPASETPQALLTRDGAIAATPRVTLDSKALFGSINLTGARIDDVSLKAYRETTNPKSPNIVLLSPSNAPTPYYAEVGYVGADSALALPNAATPWKSDGGKLTSQTPVTLTADNGHGLIFHRRIAVDDHYMFTITDTIENKSGTAVTLYPYALVSRHGKPKTSGYSILHEGMVGVVGDSGVQEPTYDSILKETNATKTLSGTGGWLGFTDKYWGAVVIPDQSSAVDATFRAWDDNGRKDYQADYRAAPVTIAADASTAVTSRVFAGAKETRLLDAYQKDLGIERFELMIDWGWFYFITKPMFWLLDAIYKVVGNFGVAILIVTVLIKTAFLPLANRSYLSMAKMKAVQPQMTAIRERYADDKIKQQQELMDLYKREKINPVSGCLPMVIQIPVFFSLYKVLFITIEMRQAPFFGWIKDLSQPDPTNIFTLFGLLHFDPTVVPMIGHFLNIGIWPLIMGVSMFVQMKMNPEPADPVQKQMFTWMPVIFTFMLGSFPSGLVIYWTWNNTLSVLQQSLIMARAGVKVELWDNIANMFRKKAPT
ncbi:MAG: membrane protein insertase YidC [Methylovirgula sp.]